MSGTGSADVGGRYDLVREIGRGSTAVVWQGRARETGVRVAVKVLRPELAADHDLVTRFVAERSLLMAVDQPNLVRVRDLVVSGEVLALVSDFVEGTSLRELVDQGPVTAAESARIAGQVAAGLRALHEAGIVHSDVKPENILIPAGEAKLADLGVAWLMRTACPTGRQAGARPLLGTPGYVAPELAIGAAPAAPADIYALGVVLYEMLTGRPPGVVDAGRPRGRRTQGETDRRAIPDVPRDLWRVVGRCLRAEPTARPTAADLAEFLSVGGHVRSTRRTEGVGHPRGFRVNGAGSRWSEAVATSAGPDGDDPPGDEATERPTIHHAELAPAEDVGPSRDSSVRRILLAAAGAATVGCVAVLGVEIASPHPLSGDPTVTAAAVAGSATPADTGERYEAPTGWLCPAPAAVSVAGSVVEVQPCLAADRTTVRATVRSAVSTAVSTAMSAPAADGLRVTLRLVDIAAGTMPLAEQRCLVASSAGGTCPEISVAAVPGAAYRAIAVVAAAGRIRSSFAKESTLTTPIVQNRGAQDRHRTRTR